MKKTLKKQIFSGIVWRGGTDVLQQVLQVVFTVILARLLTKADFGLVAMALLVNRFVRSVTNVSFGTAIIQSQEITEEQISAVFYLQTTLNVVLTVVVFFCAPLAGDFFNEPKLVDIVKVLSVLILLQSLQFPNVILQKKMQFKNFSLAQIISMLFSNIVAVILAFSGYGLWALVYRLIIQNFVFGVVSFVIGGWLPGVPDFKGLGPILKFGFNLLGRNIFYFFSENMVAVMTSKFLGKEIMGVFNIAYNLAIVPASKVQNVLTSVLTSGFSKIQNQISVFKDSYAKTIELTAMFFVPFMVCLSAIADVLIPVLYGSKWQEAALFLSILSVVGCIRGLSHLLRTAIIAKGDSGVILKSAVLELLISLPVMYFGMRFYGVLGLILGYLLGAFSNIIYLGFCFDLILEEKGLFYKSIKKSLIIGLVIYFSLMPMSFLNLPDLVMLILKLVSVLIIFVAVVWYLDRGFANMIVSKLKLRK